MASVDTALLHGLTAETAGLSVTFLPLVQGKVCHREFVNQKSLRRSVFPHAQYQSAALGLVCRNPYC